jgi:hypothetical protein
MAGVPIYCKVNNCPLILSSGTQFKCNYDKAKVKDYIEFSKQNEIEIEYLTKNL